MALVSSLQNEFADVFTSLTVEQVETPGHFLKLPGHPVLPESLAIEISF